MTKLTRKMNVNLQYIWGNILGSPSRKRMKRIYFDRKVKMITNVGIPSKDSYSLRKTIVKDTEPFDLGKAIKWLPNVFRVSIKPQDKSSIVQQNNSVVKQHEVPYKAEPLEVYEI